MPLLRTSLSLSLPLTLVCVLLTAGEAHAGFGENPPGLYIDMPGAAAPVAPATAEENPPVALESEEIGYDQEHHIVIARGKVEAAQGNYVLMADQVTYYQLRNLVVAEGNVVMMQPSGEVLFADQATLKDDMKVGIIDAFKARLSDNSLLVSRRAVKVNANVTKLSDASYTPCNVCKDMAPFWQLNADNIKVDDAEERVTYNNVNMDIFGLPVIYSPYLSHPTPSAGGKSGFLMPQYTSNENLGSLIKVPYYWRIDEDKEAVVTPWYSDSEGLLLQADYNQLTNRGSYRVQGSITNPKKIDSSGNEIPGTEIRGAIFALGEESLTDYSRIGFDIQRTTDDTYLRRYGLGGQTALFSRAFIETADRRNFAQMQGIAIQGLRATDDPKITPLVLPMLQGYYETQPDAHNIRYHMSGDAQSITREQGVNQQRLSLTLGASHPYISEGGHVLTTTLNLRQDAYYSDNVIVPGHANTVDGTTLRTLPQAALEWRYPLINQLPNGSMIIEPLVLGVLQGTGGNPDTIANEDNRLLELSDTNIFSLNRMPGLDLVDSGPRVAYGFRGQYLLSSGVSFDMLLGQSYNANSNTPFPNSTTPEEKFSDIIGRVAFAYDPITLAYRYALDNKTLSTNRNEITLGFAKPWLAVATSYRMMDNNTYLSNSQEGTLNATLPLSDAWSIYGGAQRDFDLGRMVSTNGGIVYKNECFNLMVDGLRTYSRDRDITPNTEITLRVGFKNLGEFGGK